MGKRDRFSQVSGQRFLEQALDEEDALVVDAKPEFGKIAAYDGEPVRLVAVIAIAADPWRQTRLDHRVTAVRALAVDRFRARDQIEVVETVEVPSGHKLA